MNSTINGKPVVTRSGYIVEFNALWYNALKFYKELAGDKADESVDALINKMDTSFVETFLNGYNYLLDSVSGGVCGLECTPKYDFCSCVSIFAS